MQTILLFVVAFYIGHVICFSSVLVERILSYKKITCVVLFTCFKKQQETVQLYKNISKISFVSLGSAVSNYSQQETFENFYERTQLGFLLDVSCEEHKNLLFQKNNYNIFRSPYKWIIIDVTNKILTSSSSIIQFFSNTPLRIDSDVTVIESFQYDRVRLFDVYKPHSNNNETVRVTQVGFWAPNNKMTFTCNLSRYQQRKDLTGTIIRFGVVKAHVDDPSSTDSYYRYVTTKNFDTINKLSYALYTHLLEIHNFGSIITVTDKWFGRDVGGIDEGLAKLLYEEVVDSGISAGLLKTDRIPYIDFIAPVYPFRTSFLFRNPGISWKVQNTFLKPFQVSLWYTTLGFVLLFCIVLQFPGTFSKNYEEKSWIAACLLTWSVICQQGATFIPKSTSGRLTLLSLLVMSLLLYNYYTSSIVSSLLSGLPPPFETIEELAHSDLKVGVEDTVYTRTLFERTQDERIKYLYNRKVLAHNNQPSYMTVPEGISRVKSGGFAYHSEPVLAYSIIENTFEPYEICELAEIHVFTPTVLWIMSQKHGQYNELFRIGYLRMLEFGIIVRQQSIWIAKKPACLSNMHLVEVGMQPLLPAFLVLMLGVFVSLLFLLLEVTVFRYKAKLK